MFGHLRAEDFVNSIETGKLSATHETHIDACAQCRATWDSMRSIHAEFTSMDTEIPEPDWQQFRSSVRDQLLSRAIKRESSIRRWTGWAVRPAAAWALSVVLAVGITTVTLLWKADHPAEVPVTDIESSITEPVEVMDSAPDRTLFGDLVQLGEEQQVQLQQMLESAQKEASKAQ